MEEIVVKTNKRGRKPKNRIIPILKIEQTNTDMPIIAHLPISYSEIMGDDMDEIFIRPSLHSNDKEIKILKNKIDELNEKLKKYEKVNKPSIHQLINNKSKCWWCKHSYTTPNIELPEHYYNDTFYSSGFFCSYNCACAFNIDINDENVSKRNSLLNYLYKKTYNITIDIIPAASWKILKDFGGSISIDDFRDNFTYNTMNYLYIKPPSISRISYVEKVPIIEEDIIVKTNEYVLKRSKPLNNTNFSLETTMGLKKVVNSN